MRAPYKAKDQDQFKIAKLEYELKRVKEEHDILKKAVRYLASNPE